MKSAIKVNDDFLVFKSNKIVSKGRSNLLIYSYITLGKKKLSNYILLKKMKNTHLFFHL